MTSDRGFRRLFHTFSAAFVVYYMVPVDPPWLLGVAQGVAVALVACALALEALRLTGRLPDRYFPALRSWETRRPASYVYYGVGALPLVLFVPEQITIPCILAAAFGDPFAGEARRFAGEWAGAAVGFATASTFFLIVEVPTIWVVAGAVAFVAAETLKNPWLDDDLLTLVVPALVLLSASWLGLYAPADVIAPLTAPPWL